METWLSWLTAAMLGLATVAAAPLVLRRLPAPLDHPGGPLPWAELPTRRWLIQLAVAVTVMGAVGLSLTPAWAWPLWLVWAGPVGLLVGIDAATTWLPLRLSQWCWLATAVALLAAGALGAGAIRLLTAGVAALACGGLFWLLWWFANGQLGFGDVRLAPMVGAVAGIVSPSTVAVALVAGSLVGVALGIIHQLRRRPGGFPYAPALWVGPAIALLVTSPG